MMAESMQKNNFSLLEELRARGQKNFSTLPTQRNEAWKYTALKTLESFDLLAPALPTEAPKNVVPLFKHQSAKPIASQMVFSDLEQLPKMVTLLSLADAADHHLQLLQMALGKLADATHPFVALNDLHAGEGLFLHIPAGVVLPEPLELFFMSDGSHEKMVSHPRIVIILEANAQATIIEHHLGSGAYVRNQVCEILLQEGAQLQHYRLQKDSLDAQHMSLTAIKSGRDSHYDHFTLTQGAALARQEIHATLAGENTQVNLNAAHLLNGKQHSDFTTVIQHEEPRCRSRQTVKYVLDGQSHGVFQGKIHVDQKAQKTDGYQMNQSLLLSPHAEINAKPELEIYADDVKCSHGATVGRLDEQALFYLRSRGIPLEAARALLIQSFIGGAIDLIENEMVREVFQRLAVDYLYEVNKL